MPTSAFFLGAQIVVEETEPSFSSPFDPARSRHDRLDMHFGMGNATLVQISEAIGAVPEGGTLEDVLRMIWDAVVDRESFLRQWFWLDAYVDELVFWRDLFTRTVADALGRSTGLRTTFGDFDWQTLLLEDDATVSVDGDEALLGGEMATAEFIGYPTMAQGELWFDFWFDPTAGNPWKLSIQPSRDDVTDLDFWVRARRILSSMFLEIGLGELSTDIQVFSGDPHWERVHITFGVPGDTAIINVTPVGFDESLGLEASGEVPNPNTGHRWLAMGTAGDTTYSDDAATWTPGSVGFASPNVVDVCWGFAFGVPTWMAVGSDAGVYWSRDAESWTQETTAHSPSGVLPGFGTCATDGEGTWVACNLSQTTPWRAIGDPATSFWNRQTTSLPHAVWSLRWGGGLFVAVTSFGDVATSPDGGTWTNRTTGLDPDTDWIQIGPAYGNGRWVAIGGGGAGSNEFMALVSTDGITWTPNFITPDLDDYYGLEIAFGNGLFVVVGQVGLIVTSPDGETWSLNDQGITDDLMDVAFADGTWALTTINGDIYTATDPDGTWTLQSSGISNALLTIIGRPQRTGYGTPVWHFEQTESDLSHPIDNMKTVKVDVDPPRLYHALWLDAEVVGPHFTIDAWVLGRFTINGIIKTTRTGSFTINAYVPFSGFALDGWVKATRSSSFTLDGYVPSDHSGELGDFILGDDELGGG